MAAAGPPGEGLGWGVPGASRGGKTVSGGDWRDEEARGLRGGAGRGARGGIMSLLASVFADGHTASNAPDLF